MLTGLTFITVLFLFLVALIAEGPGARNIPQLLFVAVVLLTGYHPDSPLLISANFGFDT